MFHYLRKLSDQRIRRTTFNFSATDNLWFCWHSFGFRRHNVGIDSDAEYEVENILDLKHVSGLPYYHVSWKGYPDFENTWEATESLTNCRHLLQRFHSGALSTALNAARIQLGTSASSSKPAGDGVAEKADII